ncbi:class II aldolase/adducin family protein [Collinsella sp. zg1085]|uniref:class II aldolase/adducin family protein n=1 Tax=Collinsella sp. zg1085 TaxID=2844380 RepID=UPI001C0AA536|nr:class II aldolase/adducin family protein [Collinsella sp. zg1085]QWT17644.1 class II aldolase/adducin family protein [Collinsella sp. zg1085]
MFEKQKEQVLQAARTLDRYGLIALSGGNVSWRMPTGEVLVTPSGMIYDQMVPEDMLVVSLDGSIIEGTLKASVDTEALLYIFQHKPSVQAIIHTHQPYATGLGLVMDEIPCNLSTMANATEGPVAVAAYGDPGSLSMGVEAVRALGERLAVVLKHHGVIAVGKDLKQALYACVYLEEACKTISVAMGTGNPMAAMTQEQINEAVAVFHRYGQDVPAADSSSASNKDVDIALV